MMRRKNTMWATLIFYSTAGIFAIMTFTLLWHLRWVNRLPQLDTLPAKQGVAGDTPCKQALCSVVIAARDEDPRIERTLRHLFAQRDVELEIIVVDDRSSDQTSEILHRLAKFDPRLRLKRVDVLPDGWLGKCHACHIGALAATGEWILFTDADCWIKPDVIVRAIGVAERDHADHVTMAPGTVLESVAARGWYLLFLTGLAGWFSGVNRNRPKAHVGIGAFNLVRAAAYRQCGGYEALRLSVVDDIKLGLLLHRAGHRTRAFLGAGDVECHWGRTVGDFNRIMEKNYFAALDYRGGIVLAASVSALVVLSVMVIGLGTGSAAGFAAAFSPLGLILPGMVLARRVGWSFSSAAMMPLMCPVFLYAMVNSTLVTLRQDGIRWRETFYPLATLRAGNVRS